MIYDFSRICKTYSENFYTRDFFNETSCPRCRARGRFNLHGSYSRHVVYFDKCKLVEELIKIKRIRCRSCESTHAVLPGDIIAYKLLSLFVQLSILFSFYLKEIPVLKLASKLDFSFQYIYLCLKSFLIYVNNIHQLFRETKPKITCALESKSVLSLIDPPYIIFQRKFLELNNRPCFMCKFYASGSGPPIGILSVKSAPT